MKTGVIVIAEAGVNHNGDFDLAKKLVDAAAAAGADYVKFQTFNAKKLVSKHSQKAAYQKENTSAKESQLEMLSRLELSKEAHLDLMHYCAQKKIKFLSTAFDMESIDFLNGLGIELFKIPSGEITNLPYLRKIGSLGKPIILSTGMADMDEIRTALDIMTKAGASKDRMTVLHCNTDYPTRMSDVNLLAMKTIEDELDVSIGYSDHTLGIEIPVAAVALGATVIEKHFTLDKKMPGPDHKASLEPEELAQMISSIRNIETALGHGAKEPSTSELKNKTVVRKSIVASRPIAKGTVFSDENLTVKRPGSGISPVHWDEIIGSKATKDYQEDDLI